MSYKTFIPPLNVNIFPNILSYIQNQCHNVPVNEQHFHLCELRTGCEAQVAYETRWVVAGMGATPHTAIFSLAPGKR